MASSSGTSSSSSSSSTSGWESAPVPMAARAYTTPPFLPAPARPPEGFPRHSVNRWGVFRPTAPALSSAALVGSSSTSTAAATTPAPTLRCSVPSALVGSSSTSTAAATTPAPTLRCSVCATLGCSSTSSTAAPTTPSTALRCSMCAALSGSAPCSAAQIVTMSAPPHVSPSTTASAPTTALGSIASFGSSMKSQLITMSPPAHVSSSTGNLATVSSSISATGEADSMEIFARLSTTTSLSPSMTASAAFSAPTSSSVHVQTNAFATDQAQPASSFGPSVWPSEWWPNRGDMFAMPYLEQNEELQAGDVQENDDTEQGAQARRVAESVLDE